MIVACWRPRTWKLAKLVSIVDAGTVRNSTSIRSAAEIGSFFRSSQRHDRELDDPIPR
jgi:hypothetical protein